MKKLISSILILMILIQFNIMSISADNSLYDDNRNLIYYSKEYNGSGKLTIPSVTRDKALEIAKDFITQNAPETLEHINFDNNTVIYNKTYPYGYIITIPRIINNIEYSDDNLSLFVDSKNGDVISYSKNFTDDLKIEGDYVGITENEAKIKYTSAMGIHLQYNKKISNNKIETYLTYTADDIIINAQTGNIIPTEYYIPTDGYFDVVNTAEKVSEYVDNPNIISISKANSIAHSIEELELSDDYTISSVDYLKNFDETYLISLSYKNGINTKDVTLNAENGLLIEYSDNSADITSDYKRTPEEFIESLYGSYCNSVIKRTKTDGISTALLYERLVYDIPYKSNGIYASYYNGKLKKLSFAWDNVEFSSPEGIVSTDYVYQIFFDKNGLSLTYHLRDNASLVPVYKKSNNGTGIFDAESGRQLNYDGSYYYGAKEMKYLDMNSHYSGYAAKDLSQCDIYVSSGNVFLEDYITQQEFLLLISEFIAGTKPVLNTTGILTNDQREMLYAYMYEHKILKREETNYTGYVTRTDAVKYFMRILGYGTVGEMNNIFIPHFNDSEEIPSADIGYVELARSLKIINGSTGNLFKPNQFITNGDSLIIIHNYLKG